MPLYVRHGPENDSPGCPILPNHKAVYSDDFYKDTESYTHKPVSRQSYTFHCFPIIYVLRTVDVVRDESNYLAITTVVQELLTLGKSRSAAIRNSSRGRSPRMIGQ